MLHYVGKIQEEVEGVKGAWSIASSTKGALPARRVNRSTIRSNYSIAVSQTTAGDGILDHWRADQSQESTEEEDLLE